MDISEEKWIPPSHSEVQKHKKGRFIFKKLDIFMANNLFQTVCVLPRKIRTDYPRLPGADLEQNLGGGLMWQVR